MIQTIPVADVWDQGFTALEDVSEKFAGLSDDDLDALFGEVLTEVRAAEVRPFSEFAVA
ncbi:MAG TPA: hypothetical protein VL334_20540 [Anaerolineae bacterium]|nr:hypothetical protein [Anaerolineae bacterium]